MSQFHNFRILSRVCHKSQLSFLWRPRRILSGVFLPGSPIILVSIITCLTDKDPIFFDMSRVYFWRFPAARSRFQCRLLPTCQYRSISEARTYKNSMVFCLIGIFLDLGSRFRSCWDVTKTLRSWIPRWSSMCVKMMVLFRRTHPGFKLAWTRC